MRRIVSALGLVLAVAASVATSPRYVPWRLDRELEGDRFKYSQGPERQVTAHINREALLDGGLEGEFHVTATTCWAELFCGEQDTLELFVRFGGSDAGEQRHKVPVYTPYYGIGRWTVPAPPCEPPGPCESSLHMRFEIPSDAGIQRNVDNLHIERWSVHARFWGRYRGSLPADAGMTLTSP